MIYALSDEIFEGYGIHIRQPEMPFDDRGAYHGYRHNTHMDHFNGEKLTMGYLCIDRHEPVINEMERHPDCAEIFVAVEGSGIIPLCLPDDWGSLNESIRCFRIERGDAFLIRKGVWHKLPIPDGERIGFLMVLPERILGSIDKREVTPPIAVNRD